MNDQKPPVERMAMAITRWVGSPASIVVHTALFAASFVLTFLGFVALDMMLLVLTTIVSLEAIYLAIFIQMTINFQAQDIAEVQENVEEIQEDVEDIQEDVEDISEDVDEIQKDVDELQEDVEEISDDVEVLSEEDETAEEKRKQEQRQTLTDIQSALHKLLEDVERLRK